MKKIALIGCTGNIGQKVVDAVRCYPEKFCFSALVCGKNRDALHALQEEFHPPLAFCAADGALPLDEIFSSCDIAFLAPSGFAGLEYALAAARQGKVIALSNKESLVAGGELLMKEVKDRGATLIPVDSEHSAIFQALSCRLDTPFKKLILTASGGPFLRLSKEELEHVTPKDALRHPTYAMGRKITIDSATMLNKGYEVIEAKWLFSTTFEKIETLVHPESIVHSLVCFEDGATIAEMGYPDMRVPVRLALTYPERLPCGEDLDLAKLQTLHFEQLDKEKFPCFTLALEAGKSGGTAPAALNGAAEVAVDAFLKGGISFPKIAEIILYALDKTPIAQADAFETVKAADQLARAHAKRYLYDL